MILRLVHPFPSLLNGIVVLAFALIAGGTPPVAIRLAVAMTLLQMGIGALNDVADAPHDAAHVPPKPIAAGAISTGRAILIGGSSAAAGLLLVAPMGLATALVAVAGLACGLAYDMGLSRTSISWVPLSLALPLVPAFAWIGATGHLPPGLAILIPLGVLGGAGLAIGNALVDVDEDARTGRRTVAVAIGARRARRLQAGAYLATIVLAIALLPAGRGPLSVVLSGGGTIAVGAGALMALLPGRLRRRLAWQLEAAGIATLAVGWILAVAVASRAT